MKKRVIKVVFISSILAIGLLGGNALSAMAMNPSVGSQIERTEMKHEQRHALMADILNLSEVQQEQIRAIREQEQNRHKDSRQQIRKIRKQMHELLENEVFDEAVLRSLINSQNELKTEMLVSRERVKHQVFQLLDAEQRELAKKLRPLMSKQGRRHKQRMNF